MADFASAIRGANVFEGCEYITRLCERFIDATGSYIFEYGRTLHSALPDILTTVFGAPNAKQVYSAKNNIQSNELIDISIEDGYKQT